MPDPGGCLNQRVRPSCLDRHGSLHLCAASLLTVPVLLGVATLVFALIHLVPGDPAEAMLGETASASDLDELRARLGLDQPLLAQYRHFLAGLVQGDLGTSFRYGTPVAARDRCSGWGRP